MMLACFMKDLYEIEKLFLGLVYSFKNYNPQ